jgi:hypothetical protein
VTGADSRRPGRDSERAVVKIAVIGGAGVLGSRVVDKLRDHGDEAVAVSPDTGVNTLTGEGARRGSTGADVVVDVCNSPSFDDNPAMEFLTKSTGSFEATVNAAPRLDEMVTFFDGKLLVSLRGADHSAGRVRCSISLSCGPRRR